MRKTALSDDILLRVEKPARYIGGEVGSSMKDLSRIDIRFAMCFPDVYEIGMSHLGLQIIYDQLNRRDDIWCERVFSPWFDLHNILMETGTPLFAVESQDPVKDFDFLGFTIQFELCYTNILQVLELSKIPLHAEDRTKSDPIVMGGGPCTCNPEPLADFFDLFYLGESETVMYTLMDVYKASKAAGEGRRAFLKRAAAIPGIYVPSLYEVSYNEDGTVRERRSLDPCAPLIIRKQVADELSDTFYPTHPIVPFIRATQDKAVLEIQRGCIRGCRFCQAGMLYRPTRRRSLSFLKERAKVLLENTGYEELSLSSLSSSDYPELGELLTYLIDLCSEKKVNISLPSLRIDRFSLDVMEKVQDVRKSSLTFAPEAGSQKLRNVINKGLTEESILQGAQEAFKGGWNKVKLYFMLGLPFEEEDDRKAIARLAESISETYYDTVPKEMRHGKCDITVSTSFFVAKPFTPFQWASMFDEEDYLSYAKTVREAIRAQKNQKSIRYNWHEADVTVIEGVLARGDRRLGPVIEDVYRHGALYEAWTDHFSIELWKEAMQRQGLTIEFYTKRVRNADEIFPWDFIDIGVTKKFLLKEWERAQRAEVTPNCEEHCSGCGASSYHAGNVCPFTGNQTVNAVKEDA